jgi:hypothetical protein
MDTVVTLNEWVAKIVDGEMLQLPQSTIIEVQIIRITYNRFFFYKKNEC